MMELSTTLFENSMLTRCLMLFLVSALPASAAHAQLIGWKLCEVRADGTGFRVLCEAPETGGIGTPSFSADGKTIVIEETHIGRRWQAKFLRSDSRNTSLRFLDAANPEISPYVLPGQRLASMPSFSPGGHRVAFTVPNIGTVCVMRRDFADVIQLAQAASGAVWSPDGRKIAFANRNNGNALEIYDLVEDEQYSVTNPLVRTVKLGFCWSPDSKWLAFSGYRKNGGGAVIARVRADAGERETEVLLPSVSADRVSWHPDGSKLVFSDQKPDRHHLYLIDALRPSETPTEVAGIPKSLSAAVPTWSPDGKRIVFIGLPAN